MLKHIWSVLCNKSIIDRDTNNISIVDVFEQIDINGKIASEMNNTPQINVPISFELVSLWFKEKKEQVVKADVEVDVIGPDSQILKTFPQKMEITDNLRRMRTRLRIIGLILTTSGIYFFKVKIKESGQNNYKTVAELPLEVNLKIEKMDSKN